MKAKSQIQKEIAGIDQKIAELEYQTEELHRKKNNLLKELEVCEETKQLLNRVHMVSDDNTMRVRLRNDTKTTPIMDMFQSSDKEFLLFEQHFHLWIATSANQVSLIVTRCPAGVQYSDDGLTMTDLKKTFGTILSEKSVGYIEETDRRYHLFHGLLEVSNEKLVDGQTYAFQMPCLLGGQTSGDQTGFGSEYCGTNQIYQGKLYGETTKFLIIGIVVENGIHF